MQWLLLNGLSGVWAKGAALNAVDCIEQAENLALEISAKNKAHTKLVADTLPSNTSGMYSLFINNPDTTFQKSYRLLIVDNMQNTLHHTPQ